MLSFHCAILIFSMYALVLFDDGAQIVPTDWLENDENNDVTVCAYPTLRRDLDKLRSLVKKRAPPHSTWPSFKVSVLYKNGMFI